MMSQITQRGHRVLPLPALSSDLHLENAPPSHADWLGTDWQTDAKDSQAVIEVEQLDWLVVDHYALDGRWEQCLRPYCQHMMVIDDLADRSHVCDLLLDQNLGRVADDYRGLTPPDCNLLIGPKYALLRPEFAQQRSKSLIRRGQAQLKSILISMGGIDKDNITGLVLDCLSRCALPHDLSITVVMGANAPWLSRVQAQSDQMPFPTKVLVNVSDMACLMADVDFAIGAAGGTAWERCCMGLPSFVLVLAANQLAGAQALQKLGAAIVIQDLSSLQKVFEYNFQIICSGNLMQNMILLSANVTDGLGCDRVLEQFTVNND
jgi:UDP-2,4-diacetamido-2,4,6-trideoxy-beta-L-altropyranose hydrolase